jgi:hypothetical protein
MTNQEFQTLSWRMAMTLLLALGVSCSRQKQTGSSGMTNNQPVSGQVDSGQVVLRKMPTGKGFSGFLKDYSNLKPNPNLEGNALTFTKADEQKNLHKYIAVIVDPVQVYLASDADESKLPEKARGVGARYFHKALVGAVSSAFPIVDQPGPLVLRLRAAIIGVDVGREIPSADKSADPDALDRTVNIGKVGVEMELVDSETGEQIAALVDRESLGAGAEIGAVNFSKQEKWAAAREAFDGWAHRVRTFLDTAHELSTEDAKRADQSYRPYGEEGARP